MTYPITEIKKILKASWLQQGSPVSVSHLLTDSRKLIYADQTLFIALVTSQRDGHQFIGSLYHRGVRAFLVSQPIDVAGYPGASFIRVPDTLAAFQALVAFHRRRFSIPVVAVTGSNGKTIVKEWLYQLLEADYRIVRSPKSYNSQTGVPLSVWQMDTENTLALFEAGISRPGEMANLEKIIQPTIGIFTNIGDAHNEGFLNIMQKIREKLLLFTGVRSLIYCKDYPELHECVLQFHHLMRRKTQDDETPLQLFSWSYKNEATLRVTAIDKPGEANGQASPEAALTRIEAEYQGRPVSIRIPFADQGSIENAIHAWCVMLLLEIPDDQITRRMEQLSRIAMRLELKAAIGDCSLINDSYNSDLGSLAIALDFLSQQKQHARRTLILSDILQSGRSDADLYEDVAGLLEQKGVNRLIGIGRNISREKDIFARNKGLTSRFFLTTEDFIDHLLVRSSDSEQVSFQDETILLKGARVFAFERIGKLLEQKTHQTVLEINLNALVHNLKAYQALLAPGVKTMVMVKAFSYGSGSYEVANLLQFHQTDYLAVAYADEGIALRQKGIGLPIMVMNPEPGTFQAIIRWNLEPEIYSMQLLEAFTEALGQAGKEAYPIHIKLDTGMHRLGFGAEAEVLRLADRLAAGSPLRVVSVFSHLAASGDPAFRDFTGQQAQRFNELSSLLTASLPYPVIRHLANSAAIAAYPELQYDMVRLGIGLYGIDETGTLPTPLEVVTTLKTTVSQIRTVAAGETVGYGRQGKVTEDKRIATVPVGYADGYQRVLGNGKGSLYIHGKPAPVIGNICMDMLMVDVTGIPEASEGDTVVVFGDKPTITEVAAWAGTIPYEIMTGVSGRVKRIYIQE